MIDKKYLDYLNIKPFSYEKKGSVIIVNKTYVFKENKKDLKDVFTYLDSRSFELFPSLIYSDKDVNVFKYIEREKEDDIVDTLVKLHKKTTIYEPCDKSFYEDMYNSLLDKVKDIREFYLNLNEEIENEIYMSPSNYLLIRNISKIYNNLNYVEDTLNTWYETLKDKDNKRTVINHNNLKKEHMINNIFISWEKSMRDIPVMDLYNYYKNVYDKESFTEIFNTYLEKYSLDDEEISLFFILISMPKKIEKYYDEYENVKEVDSLLNYIYKTDSFISNYYPDNKEQE